MTDEEERVRRSLVLIPVVVYVIALLKTAWLSDDAFITLRTVQNVNDGYGLTWNVTERVQAFTHPLWALLLSLGHFFTGELYLTTLFLSGAVSLAAILLLGFRIASAPASAVLALTLLVFSQAFVDYSTSGLESPLTHLLIALFILIYTRDEPGPKTLFFLTLIAALAMTNRMDIALIYAPALAVTFFRLRSVAALRAMALGLSPFLLWEAFSVLYYGTPFPNTAYAKLALEVPYGEQVTQGVIYFIQVADFDPVTLLGIAAGVLVPLFVKSRPHLPLVLGMLLYVVYVVHVGGDFMAGRLFTPVLFCAAALLSRYGLPASSTKGVTGLLLLLLFVAVARPSQTPTFAADANYGESTISANGISDQRRFYFGFTGLSAANRVNRSLAALKGQLPPLLIHDEPFLTSTPCGGLGFIGILAGPHRYVVDICGLSDPLLARLPPLYDSNWRPGHLVRAIPAGYLESRMSGKNVIEDENLALYFDKVTLITQGNLFSVARWIAIMKMNFGAYDGLIDHDDYKYAKIKRIDLAHADAGILFDHHGLQIDLGGEQHVPYLDIGWNHDDFRLVFLAGGEERHVESLKATSLRLGKEIYHFVEVPEAIAREGYSALRILPIRQVRYVFPPPRVDYALSHLSLVDLGPKTAVTEELAILLRAYYAAYHQAPGSEREQRLAEIRARLVEAPSSAWADVPLEVLADLQLVSDEPLLRLLEPPLAARLPANVGVVFSNEENSARLRVLGYTLNGEAGAPGSEVTFYFESLSRLRTSYNVRLEPVGSGAGPPPGAGLPGGHSSVHPTQMWSVGRVYRDTLPLPSAPGPFRISFECSNIVVPCSSRDELYPEPFGSGKALVISADTAPVEISKP